MTNAFQAEGRMTVAELADCEEPKYYFSDWNTGSLAVQFVCSRQAGDESGNLQPGYLIILKRFKIDFLLEGIRGSGGPNEGMDVSFFLSPNCAAD